MTTQKLKSQKHNWTNCIGKQHWVKILLCTCRKSLKSLVSHLPLPAPYKKEKSLMETQTQNRKYISHMQIIHSSTLSIHLKILYYSRRALMQWRTTWGTKILLIHIVNIPHSPQYWSQKYYFAFKGWLLHFETKHQTRYTVKRLTTFNVLTLRRKKTGQNNHKCWTQKSFSSVRVTSQYT